MTRIERLWFILLSILTALSLAMMLTLSLMPPSINAENTEAAGDIVGSIVDKESVMGEFLQTNISNIAHFCEFFVYGTEIALLYFLLKRRRNIPIVYPLLIALSTALLDETLQIFSGRHASVTDMWIDLLGFSASFLTVVFIKCILTRISAQNEKRKKSNG